jgi:hypothetical protein
MCHPFRVPGVRRLPFPPGMHRPAPLPPARPLLLFPLLPAPAHPCAPPAVRAPRARARDAGADAQPGACGRWGEQLRGPRERLRGGRGLGLLLRQTPPRRPHPLLLPPRGALSGARSEVGGLRRVRAVRRVGKGGAGAGGPPAARSSPRAPTGPSLPLQTPPPPPPAPRSGPLAPRLCPRLSLGGTPLGDRNAPEPLPSPWLSAR